MSLKKVVQYPWDGVPGGGCGQEARAALAVPPGCLRPAEGELCPALRLPALSQPFWQCFLPWPKALLPGTALALWVRGRPNFECTSHGTGCVCWSPEGTRLHSHHGENLAKMACGLVQVLPKYPRLSPASATSPVETRSCCVDTGTSEVAHMRQSGHLCCVPHRAGRVPHLAAQSSLPGEWCQVGQMEKGKGAMALIGVTRDLRCETTA